MYKALAMVLGAALLGGCAGYKEYMQAKEELAQGRTEDALRTLDQARKLDPMNAEYRSVQIREQEKLVRQALIDGDKALSANDLDGAEGAYRRALSIDEGNPRALSGMDSVLMAGRHNLLLAEAEMLQKRGDWDGVQSRIKRVLDENPKNASARQMQQRLNESVAAPDNTKSSLKAAYRKPVTLEFRDTALRSVFELLSRSSGLNFMFDKDVKPDLRVSIFVRNTTLEEAVRYLLVTNQLEQRVLNESTVLIYPNTAAKNKEYQEQIVRSFYLGNSDVKRTLEMLKTIVRSKDIYVDEKLNLLIMRDTQEAVRLAQKLIANQDMAEPEVMLELEVLEIGTNKLLELGIRFPDTVSASVSGAAGVAGSLQLPELRQFNSGMVTLSFNNPLVVANLKRTVTDQNLLANPRVRVRNREKARIHIGEKVPVITTTSTANVGISESINYLDVGLKLEVEPNIYLEDEVAMKVGLEVSNIVEIVTRASGLQTYRLGTRNASTVLRLKNNETQILAGLIQKDERSSSTRVPGLGDIPILGRLFSNQNDTNTKTEIVLLITPRVIRNITRVSADAAEFSSGTENAIGAANLTLRSQTIQPAEEMRRAIQAQPVTTPSPIPAPVAAPPVAPQPQINRVIVPQAPLQPPALP